MRHASCMHLLPVSCLARLLHGPASTPSHKKGELQLASSTWWKRRFELFLQHALEPTYSEQRRQHGDSDIHTVRKRSFRELKFSGAEIDGPSNGLPPPFTNIRCFSFFINLSSLVCILSILMRRFIYCRVYQVPFKTVQTSYIHGRWEYVRPIFA
jgi:hypothetical protein